MTSMLMDDEDLLALELNNIVTGFLLLISFVAFQLGFHAICLGLFH